MKNYSVILFLVATLASFAGYADDRESENERCRCEVKKKSNGELDREHACLGNVSTRATSWAANLGKISSSASIAAASPNLQSATPSLDAMLARRTSLGAVNSQTLTTTTNVTRAGTLSGNLVAMTYKTQFQSALAYEIIVMQQDASGVWQVVSYQLD